VVLDGYRAGLRVAETTRECGRSADELASWWVTLWEYAHERAEEARGLIHKLALG
jgi:hypothetical protein